MYRLIFLPSHKPYPRRSSSPPNIQRSIFDKPFAVVIRRSSRQLRRPTPVNLHSSHEIRSIIARCAFATFQTHCPAVARYTCPAGLASLEQTIGVIRTQSHLQPFSPNSHQIWDSTRNQQRLWRSSPTSMPRHQEAMAPLPCRPTAQRPAPSDETQVKQEQFNGQPPLAQMVV